MSWACMSKAMRTAWLLGFAGVVSCLSPADDGAEPTVFLAQTRNFRGFMGWPKHQLGEAQLDDGTYANRTVYINEHPEPGRKSYPVGTIFVKTTESGSDRRNWQVHAMVKRGRGFNLAGAQGWEWLELSEVGDNAWQIDWRGEEPPNGASYRCVMETGVDIPSCNGCHLGARARDYVISGGWGLR